MWHKLLFCNWRHALVSFFSWFCCNIMRNFYTFLIVISAVFWYTDSCWFYKRAQFTGETGFKYFLVFLKALFYSQSMEILNKISIFMLLSTFCVNGTVCFCFIFWKAIIQDLTIVAEMCLHICLNSSKNSSLLLLILDLLTVLYFKLLL